MNHLDVYYRALLCYRQHTLANRECTNLRTSIANANSERDKITVKRAICTIDEDWVEAIEKGLIHVEKAIKEERQFIRSNGEVVPIEKVKNVSKESVEHLAKHSSLITRYEEGEDIVPDKLYTVERLSDYAVYENRFLYMLLCYLRDFVTLRYNKILDLTNKYDGTIDLNKEIVNGKQKIRYTLTMHDERRDDPYLKEHNLAKDIIDRIDLVLKTILAFLATPLMEWVSKVPMIKPPITKTNVLKMNNNFKGAVALYDYIIAYDKPGYSAEEIVTNLCPFREDLADEIAEAGALVSFLAYQYGLGIKNDLKEAYNIEEDRRRLEEINQRAERLKALERKVRAAEVSLEEYTLTLEKQLRALEGEAKRSEALGIEITSLKEKDKEQTKRILNLVSDIEALNNEIDELKRAHYEEIEALKEAHNDAMHELILKHEEEVSSLNAEHEDEINSLKSEHSSEIEKMNAIIEETKEQCKSAVENAEKTVNEKNAELEELQNKYNSLLEEKRLAEARIKALGGITEDYTDRARFNELEEEYNAFTRLYKQEWAKTKKKIRKNHLNIENLKGQKEQNKNSD